MADIVARYKELPVITRGYVTLCLITTAACTLEVGSPLWARSDSRGPSLGA